MLNHIARKKLSYTKKLPPSPAYVLVYDTVPINKLITKDELVINIINRDAKEARIKNKKILFVNNKAVYNVIEEMVKQGFLKEITGVHLEKIIES